MGAYVYSVCVCVCDVTAEMQTRTTNDIYYKGTYMILLCIIRL